MTGVQLLLPCETGVIAGSNDGVIYVQYVLYLGMVDHCHTCGDVGMFYHLFEWVWDCT